MYKAKYKKKYTHLSKNYKYFTVQVSRPDTKVINIYLTYYYNDTVPILSRTITTSDLPYTFNNTIRIDSCSMKPTSSIPTDTGNMKITIFGQTSDYICDYTLRRCTYYDRGQQSDGSFRPRYNFQDTLTQNQELYPNNITVYTTDTFYNSKVNQKKTIFTLLIKEK